MADEEQKVLATYTSHPIHRFRAGRFRFENATLKLYTEQDVNEFESSLAGMPLSERNRIKRVDLAAAERIVRERIASQGGATKVTDSSAGERAGNVPQVGIGDLLKQAEPESAQTEQPESEAPEEKPVAKSLLAGLKK